jgi:hypothetical protein
MGNASDEVVEGGAHPGRLSTARGAEEFDGRREWQQGPALVGGREEGEGTTR